MAILTNINGVPLYSTVAEALAYAASNGLTGYHSHVYQGEVGYMGGSTHGQAATSSSGFNGGESSNDTASSSSSGGGGY
tara:strand:- start:62 stop:298 length:237 start_codon:yes stop_codon:yes gene_type:complete